jgi:hypothetical protein
MIKSRRMKWAGYVARMGQTRNAYRNLLGRPEGKRQLGRPGRRWEDNIKIDVREIGWGDADWIDLANSGWVTVGGSCEHGSETSGSIKCGKILY